MGLFSWRKRKPQRATDNPPLNVGPDGATIHRHFDKSAQADFNDPPGTQHRSSDSVDDYLRRLEDATSLARDASDIARIEQAAAEIRKLSRK
jgi:hypothetical protein